VPLPQVSAIVRLPAEHFKRAPTHRTISGAPVRRGRERRGAPASSERAVRLDKPGIQNKNEREPPGYASPMNTAGGVITTLVVATLVVIGAFIIQGLSKGRSTQAVTASRAGRSS
jgi:hypothetical protein